MDKCRPGANEKVPLPNLGVLKIAFCIAKLYKVNKFLFVRRKNDYVVIRNNFLIKIFLTIVKFDNFRFTAVVDLIVIYK